MAYIPTITETRIASDAVTSAKIAADAVGSSEIATDAVGSVELAADSVTSAEIAAGAVGASEIADGSITDTEIATANKDGLAATPSLRTLGTGAQQALAGNTTLDVIANPVADLDMDGFKITDLADPTLAQDAATKAYVDSLAVGLDPKESVLYTTTGNITLSGLATQANGTWPAALTAGDRILVKNQTAQDDNGIYEAAAGAWTRSADFDGTPSSEVTNGAFTLVAASDGTAHVATGWVVTSADPIVVNTDPIVFTQITSPGAVTTLDSLTDVDTTGVVTNAAIRFDGTNWVDTTNIKLDDANKRIDLDATKNIRVNGSDIEVQAVGAVVMQSVLKMNDGAKIDAAGVAPAFHALAADTTLSANIHNAVLVDSSAAVRTITLPSGSSVVGQWFRVKRSGANNVVVAAATGNVEGAASFTLANNLEAFDFVFDGTDWWVY